MVCLIGCGKHMNDKLIPAIKRQGKTVDTIVRRNVDAPADAGVQQVTLENVPKCDFYVCAGPAALHTKIVEMGLRPLYVEKPLLCDPAGAFVGYNFAHTLGRKSKNIKMTYGTVYEMPDTPDSFVYSLLVHALAMLPADDEYTIVDRQVYNSKGVLVIETVQDKSFSIIADGEPVAKEYDTSMSMFFSGQPSATLPKFTIAQNQK